MYANIGTGEFFLYYKDFLNSLLIYKLVITHFISWDGKQPEETDQAIFFIATSIFILKLYVVLFASYLGVIHFN